MRLYKQKDWTVSKLIRVHPEYVKLLETIGNYTKIVLADDTCYEIRTSLATVLKKLPEELFIQVHRNYAASVLYIDIVGKESITIGENELPIARERYDEVIEQLNIIEYYWFF